MRFDIIRFKLQCLAKAKHSLLKIALILIYAAQVIVGFWAVRINPQRLLMAFCRFSEIPLGN